MDLFSLPPEVVLLIMQYVVLSRELPRVMRIRLVSRQFKNYVDDAVFSLYLLSRYNGTPWWVSKCGSLAWNAHQGRTPYVCSYLIYQARREKHTTSQLGRVYRTAKAICELDGDAVEGEAFSARLDALIRLAFVKHAQWLFREPTTESSTCSESELQVDVYVAAVYFGRHTYVRDLISAGVELSRTYGMGRDSYSYSTIFGYAFDAALRQGDLAMISLLHSHNHDIRDPEQRAIRYQADLLTEGNLRRHRALVDLTLAMRPINIPATSTERRHDQICRALEGHLRSTPWPDIYERVLALLGPDPRRHCPFLGLTRAARRGDIDMVRYFLSKVADPNPSGRRHNSPRYQALSAAVERCHEATARILLDAGVDPNNCRPPETPLVLAAWRCSVRLVRMLLDYGADVNEGRPPPIVIAVIKEDLGMFRFLREHGAKIDTPETGGWAMALAKSHGLSSMMDLLVREGVGEDVVLHRVAWWDEQRWWYRRLWPLWARQEPGCLI
ncbi:ankyrin [Camillea tinctor]|nr:ankyrin [Camillea tinctor]